MTDREIMQQALEALDTARPACFADNTLEAIDNAITALRERLAQPLVSSDGTSTWIDVPQRPVTPQEMQPCAGRNCGSTNPNLHSAECFEDYEKSSGMAQPDAYGYASRLAVAIWEQHYKDVAPQWKPLDDLIGVLTQIDNMTSGLTRLAQPEQEPVALEAAPLSDYSKADGDFYKWWYSHMQNDLMQPPLNEVGYRVARYIWDAALRERLAQPEQPAQQEPVARVIDNGTPEGATEWIPFTNRVEPLKTGDLLYTTPPQRKPLTDEEIEREWQFLYDEEGNPPDHHDFARAIEAAHGIKENT